VLQSASVWETQPNRGHVFLVDNDASLRRALSRAIRLAGFQVDVFASAEALLALGAAPPHSCLVLDVNLAGVGGIELKHRLDASGCSLPTIFITALEANEVDAPLAALAPVAVLHKPFDNKALLDAIGRACR
jgi:FixJ family two-component response regulator